MSKFLSALTAAKLDAVEVIHPEVLSGAHMLRPDLANRATHLAFYPPEWLRLLKGSRNILMFAWEFSTIKTDAMLLSSHAFGSQVSMLRLVDAGLDALHLLGRCDRSRDGRPRRDRACSDRLFAARCA